MYKRPHPHPDFRDPYGINHNHLGVYQRLQKMNQVDTVLVMNNDLPMAVFLIGVGVTLVVGDSSVPESGPFNPQNPPGAQPKTFSPPIPDHDCTVYKPGTYWHFINPYTGRCCEQIFVINGSYRICDTNGGQDQLVQCPKDSYNLNIPYFSGRFQFQEDAMELCDDNMVIDAYLNITWDYDENFTTREGMSVVMRGTVHSSSDLTVAYLFKDNNSVPFRKMTCRNLKEENTWLAEQKLENLTLDCAGLYSILAVNTLTHARSRIARLTVLPKACQKYPTILTTPPNPTEKQDACEKCPTTVTTPPNPTEKQDGIGRINIYYILLAIIPVVVVFLLYLICRKNRRETLKKKQVEEDHDNDEKDNVTDTLMMNTQRGGQLETTV